MSMQQLMRLVPQRMSEKFFIVGYHYHAFISQRDARSLEGAGTLYLNKTYPAGTYFINFLAVTNSKRFIDVFDRDSKEETCSSQEQ